MKIGIYLNADLNDRAGGPAGYLNSLKCGLNMLENSKHIDIISKDECIKIENKSSVKSKIIKSFKKYLPFVHEKMVIKKFNSNLQNEKLNEFNIVMFHSTRDYYQNVNNLSNKTIKVLMSHCPESPAQELVYNMKTQYCNHYSYNNLRKFYDENIDKFSFRNADYIIFPSKEAMEPYYDTIKDFNKVIQNKKIKYLMTGTNPLSYQLESHDFRKKYNIPENSIVLSYVGRYNEIKGFKTLLSIMSKIFEKREDIYIVTAGAGPISPINHKNWINIGWTRDPGSIINASDLFILPNKQTYFDLILLEVLSLGKPVLASNKGGNKTIANLTEGVTLFNDKNIEEAVKLIESMTLNKIELQKKGNSNKKLFDSEFTIEKFAERYVNLFNEIENEINKF